MERIRKRFTDEEVAEVEKLLQVINEELMPEVKLENE